MLETLINAGFRFVGHRFFCLRRFVPHFLGHHRLGVLAALFVSVAVLPGCAQLPASWQVQKEKPPVTYSTRSSPLPALPEFKAEVTVQAPMSVVKNILMDFARHPQWVFGCQRSDIIALDNYTDATVYQITQLPIVRNRDVIMAAKARDGENNQGQPTFTVTLEAAPDFCQNNTSAGCQRVNQSKLVRVRQAQGSFTLTELAPGQTQVIWQQYLDPAGNLPAWLYRANLAQVPIKTLRNLKQLVESEVAGGH